MPERITRKTAFRYGAIAISSSALAITNAPEILADTAFGTISNVLFPPQPRLKDIDAAMQISLQKRIAATRTEAQYESINHPELYRNMEIGFSYATPEPWMHIDGKYGAVAELERIFKEDIFSHIRFEMPWVTPNGYSTERPDGTVDTKQIEPFLELAIKYGVTSWINVGPIKYFRWPEDSKQPVTLFRKGGIKKPPHGTEITLNSPFGQRAMEYYIHELQALRKIVPPGYPVNIQLDNEPHHPFGDNQWTISKDLLIQEALYANAYFPKSKFLLNSAGRNDAFFLIDTFETLMQQHPEFIGRCVLGLDFYSFYDKGRYLYTYDKQDSHDKNPSYAEVKQHAKDKGIEIQISELQAEAWGQPQLLRAQSLKFNMEWCVENMVDIDNPYVVSLWGAELLAAELGKNPRSKNTENILSYFRQLQNLKTR